MAVEHSRQDGADAGAGVSLAQAVYRHSQRRPDALALASQGRQFTYAQLARQAAGLAAHLRAQPAWPRASAEPPRVGLLVGRGAPACVALLGASWAGATYVPIGLKLSEPRILHILSRCRLAALLVDAQGAAVLGDALRRAAPPLVVLLDDGPVAAPDPGGGLARLDLAALQALPAGPPAAMRAQDAAYIMFTSGTTGLPKGVVVPVGAVRHYVATMTALLGLRPGDRALETFEPSFDASVHNLFCTWQAGASVHVLPAQRVMNAVGFARDQALTVWIMVPSLAGLLRQVRALAPGALPGLRITCFGGEPLTAGIVRAWRAAAPASALWNLYGPTEATVSCLAQRVDEPLPLLPGRDVVAIGQPLAGSQAAVIDAAGQPLPDGRAGELAVAGAQLALGYLDAPQQTAQRFVTLRGRRWYRTGDLALRDAAGRFHCLGRLDHQVKVRGHRVELEEVDVHLRQALDAAVVATVAWPLVDGVAQGLVAFIGASAVDEAGAVRALQARLPPYMVPARVFALPQMPFNASGKIDRQALRQRLDAGAR